MSMKIRWTIAAVSALGLALLTLNNSDLWDFSAHAAANAACPANAKPANLNFTLKDISGKDVKLSSLKGKVVLLDFWATWCEPCKKSFPKLQELNVKYGGQGFMIVGISEDDSDEGIADFVKGTGAKFKVGLDPDNKSIAAKYKWEGFTMPSSVIIDKKGVVRFIHAGYHDGEENEVEKEVKSLLDEK